MADKIISLAEKRLEREAHVTGEAFCLLCCHSWQAVWPIGVTELECPSCHSMRGRGKFDITPAPGSKVWTCVKCSCDVFYLLPDRVHCPGCGNQWSYQEMANGYIER